MNAQSGILSSNGRSIILGQCHSGEEADTPEENLRKRRARATQRITALGEMTGGIAHDFRNILAIINSGLRLAQGSGDDPEKSQAYLAAAQEGVERGLRLTSRLLNFAKPQELDIHPEDANELIRKLALFLKYGAGPGIRIKLELSDDIPVCLIEPSQFNAAILNLVVNARDAMPDGGEITISTRACEFELPGSAPPACNSYLRIRVTDNGQGMSADTVARIFDPYFTTKGNTGTGLGVPQVHAFMELIGGQVRVTSAPGVGTSFDLMFPAHDGVRGPDILWRQIDRWTNEGGAPDRSGSSIAWSSAFGRVGADQSEEHCQG